MILYHGLGKEMLPPLLHMEWNLTMKFKNFILDEIPVLRQHVIYQWTWLFIRVIGVSWHNTSIFLNIEFIKSLKDKFELLPPKDMILFSVIEIITLMTHWSRSLSLVLEQFSPFCLCGLSIEYIISWLTFAKISCPSLISTLGAGLIWRNWPLWWM